MLDTVVSPRPGCQPLPSIATFLGGLPRRVATDGVHIPSPGGSTDATLSPSFNFTPPGAATTSFSFTPPGAVSDVFTFRVDPGSQNHDWSSTTPTTPCTPRGREAAATIANMGHRIAADGFFIASPAVRMGSVPAAFTFDDVKPPSSLDRDVGCDLDLKTPPMTPRGREVALLLSSMGRRVCRDGFYVTSPLVRDLDVTRQDDVTPNVFSFSDVVVSTLMTSLSTSDVHDVNSVTSQTALADHHYSRRPLPSPLALPVLRDGPEVADRKQDAICFWESAITVAPIPSSGLDVILIQSSPDDHGVTGSDVSVPEYVRSPAETAKRARRACVRPHRYRHSSDDDDDDTDAEVVLPVAPPTPPRTARRRRHDQRRQNGTRRRLHSPLKKSTSPVTRQTAPIVSPTSTAVPCKEEADKTTLTSTTSVATVGDANSASPPTSIAAPTAPWSPRPKPRGGRDRKSLPCPMCERTFTSAFSLRQHANTHTGARPYVCDVCHKDFAQVSTLRTHRRLHTGERPYRCRHCDRTYSDYSTWTKHERTHTGTRPYSCATCGAAFTQSGNLKRHQRACRG